jgi:hypothetical protein
MFKCKTLLAVCLLLAACAVTLLAQAGNGSIAGTVRESSGSAVPNAAVVVINTDKGIRRELQTTGAGVFNAPSLVPAGGYSVEVSVPGFAKYEAKNITLQVGAVVDLDIALQIASASTTVEVSTVAQTVDDTKSGVTDLVNQLQIDNLPINGRRADTFALLTPGVTRDGTFGLVSFHGTSAGNAFMTDGNYTTDSFYSENAGRTRISTQISQDAVQEFQVLSDGYSAEFGRASGGIINTVTRSGTNEFHGTAYEFFRNRTLNATDRYSTFNAPEWRHQAGGTIGGPIVKNKLFFFTNYELVKRNFPALNRITTPLIADPTGNFVLPSNCTVASGAVKGATQAQCGAASAFIQKQMGIEVPRTVSSDIGFAKLDYHPNERNSITADMNVMHWVSPNGIQTQSVLTSGAALGNNGNSTVETRYGNLDWTFIISPNALNDFRFGWFKDRLSDPASSALWPSTGPLYITVAGATVGASQAYPRTYPSEQRFQFADNFSWTKGSHSIKAGLDIDRTQDYLNQLYNYAGGYSYPTLTSFAQDFSAPAGKDYTNFTQAFGNPIQNLYTTNLNFYVQDLWKVTRKLTLNYGIRWEKSFLPQPTMSDPNYPLTGKIPSPDHNFAPRFSLAYAADDKTVIRAGFGIFYAPFITDGIDSLFLGNGKYQTSISVNPNQPGAPTFPNVVLNAGSVPPGTANITYADPNFHNPYSEQATFAVQRQLPFGMDMTASYVYVRGVGLITSPDVNLSAPTQTNTYIIDNSANQPVGAFTTPIWTAANKLDPRYAHIYETGNGGESWYSGLTFQLSKKMSHGFMAQVAYTWSHAIDDAQQSGASGAITYAQSSTYNGDYLLDKGTSGTDQRQRLSVNWLWAPTFTKNTSVFARYIVNGWQLSTITTIGTALPATATVSLSGSQFTGASQLLYTSSLNGSGGWNRVPFLPVNSQPIDNEYHVDARLSRELPFTERIKAYLMFEAFNVFNTQYNTGINTTAYTASNGVLKPVTSFGTGNASQAFPDGTNARRMQAAFRLTF